jgi:UDP-N-acetyl-2-amino-2-deoxyglucuronate dehydrogenase
VKNFVLIGAAGFVAPRHMRAIKETGNTLVAALDKHDSVGILDSYFPSADFFTEFERFDRHCEKLRRSGTPVDYVSVCSPNYLHDAHCRFGLRIGADVICEKPVVLNPWNLDALIEMEKEMGRQIHCVLQLRLHPAIIELKEKVAKATKEKKYVVELKYISCRGNWYQHSWKGDIDKSGGIATNIGLHFFDLLIWIFGSVKDNCVDHYDKKSLSGNLSLELADVSWTLSIDEKDLPDSEKAKVSKTYRAMFIDGEEVQFDTGFNDLHVESYRSILSGYGVPLIETRDAIQLVHDIRIQTV